MTFFASIFKKKRFFWICLVIVIILCYGFTLTNYSIGIDDEAADVYWENQSLAKSGRFGSSALSLIFNIQEALPFWRDFIAVLVLCFAAAAYATYFNNCADKGISSASQTIFGCVFVSFPIIAFIFVFMNATIEFACTFAFAALALLLIQKWQTQKKKWVYALLAVALVALGMSFFEYAVTNFIVGALGGYQLYALKNKNSWKDFLKFIVLLAVFSVAAVGVYYVVGRLVQLALFAAPAHYAGTYFAWSQTDVGTFVKSLLKNFRDLFYATTFFKIYVISTIAFLATSVFLSIRNKKPQIIVCAVLVIIAGLMMYIITGNPTINNRTMVTEALYAGFVWLFLYESASRKWLKNIVVFLVILVVFYSSKEMNELFYTDYLRYKMDLQRAYRINDAVEAASKGDTDMPVIFIGTPEEYTSFKTYSVTDVIGYSMFSWDSAFNAIDSERIHGFFAVEGMEYQAVSDEQAMNALNEAELMPEWPQEGSVKAVEDYIIVKFSDSPLVELDEIDEKPAATGVESQQVAWHIDTVEMSNWKMAYVTGWCHVENVDTSQAEVTILLNGQGSSYSLPTRKVERKDVVTALALSENDLQTGFATGMVEFDFLQPGKYEIELLVEEGESKIIIKTDTILEVPE